MKYKINFRRLHKGVKDLNPLPKNNKAIKGTCTRWPEKDNVFYCYSSKAFPGGKRLICAGGWIMKILYECPGVIVFKTIRGSVFCVEERKR